MKININQTVHIRILLDLSMNPRLLQIYLDLLHGKYCIPSLVSSNSYHHHSIRMTKQVYYKTELALNMALDAEKA